MNSKIRKLSVVAIFLMIFASVLTVGAQDPDSGVLTGFKRTSPAGIATPPPGVTILQFENKELGFNPNNKQYETDQAQVKNYLSFSAVGDPSKDGWSWDNINYLIITLNQDINPAFKMVAKADDYSDNNDGQAIIVGKAGDRFAATCSGDSCQIDISYNIPATPGIDGAPVPPSSDERKGHLCKVCVPADPQTFDCVFPFVQDLGGMVDAIEFEGQDLTPFATILADQIRFKNMGDFLNSNPTLNIRINGKQYQLQITAGVTYATDRKYCYVIGGAPGNVIEITTANGMGSECPNQVLVWKEDPK